MTRARAKGIQFNKAEWVADLTNHSAVTARGGHPRVGTDPSYVGVRVSRADRAAWEAEARAHGLSLSAFIRLAVTEYVEQQQREEKNV